MDERILNGISKNALAITLGLFLVLSVLYLHFRILDSDEGFFIVAANTFPGKLPYGDYFFTQAPLSVPYYSFFLQLPFTDLESARVGALLLSLGTIFLVYRTIKHQLGKKAAVIGTFLLSLNFFFIQWGVVAKTYALAIFLIAAFLYCMQRYTTTKENKFLVLAGLSVGLGVGVRLILGVLGIPLLYVLYKHWNIRKIALTAVGFMAGIIPALLLILPSPDRFLFDTLQWHTLRSESTWLSELEAIFGTLVGKSGSLPIPYLANIILLGLAAYFVYLFFIQQKKHDEFVSVLLLSLVTLFVAIILTPLARDQYFVILLPVLVLLAIRAWPASRNVQIGLLILFVLPTLLLVGKPILSGSEGIHPGELSEFSAWIQKQVPESTAVFSHDSFFPLLSHRLPVMDQSMGRTNYSNSWELPTTQADHYHIQNKEKVMAALADPLTQTMILLPDEYEEATHTFVVLVNPRTTLDLNPYGFVKKGEYKGHVLLVKEN